jgi:integrase
MKTFEDTKNGQEVAKQSGQASQTRFHVDYWKERLYRKTYTRDGVSHEVPEWSVRLQHLGRREAFALDTANASAAATKAKEIATFLDANGWAVTLAKFKPSPSFRAEVCTLGDFLADVRRRSHLKPMTVRRYAVKLRKMVADVAKVDADVKGKARKAKYDYVNGGRAAWLGKVDAQKLDVLTADAVNAWRNQYVGKAGNDPLARKSAERSAASYLRCARALFTQDVVSVLKVKLPANPFAGVKLKDPGPARYHSEVNPEWLLGCAERELRAKRPQLYLALFLCLWAGLRRKEADLLAWEQVDFAAGEIHIRRTAFFEPKTEESQRDIDLAPAALDVLRPFKAGSQCAFVLAGSDPHPAATYDFYRCDCTWRDLNAWLRAKGIHQTKAIHSLRKESGSLIASTFGIEAARQHLGHRDIRTTSSHYVDKKKRVEVILPIGAAGHLHVAEG